MQQRPSLEADSRSANQEIPCFLRNLKDYYCCHLYPVHTLPVYYTLLSGSWTLVSISSDFLRFPPAALHP
jgi:hypothetical protein